MIGSFIEAFVSPGLNVLWYRYRPTTDIVIAHSDRARNNPIIITSHLENRQTCYKCALASRGRVMDRIYRICGQSLNRFQCCVAKKQLHIADHCGPIANSWLKRRGPKHKYYEVWQMRGSRLKLRCLLSDFIVKGLQVPKFQRSFYLFLGTSRTSRTSPLHTIVAYCTFFFRFPSFGISIPALRGGWQSEDDSSV